MLFLLAVPSALAIGFLLGALCGRYGRRTAADRQFDVLTAEALAELRADWLTNQTLSAFNAILRQSRPRGGSSVEPMTIHRSDP
jgi:hypothetical protein